MLEIIIILIPFLDIIFGLFSFYFVFSFEMFSFEMLLYAFVIFI